MSVSYRADGAISISVFVKESATNDNSVAQAGSGDKPIGISQESASLAPYGSNASGAAVSAGDFLRVYQVRDICNLQAGSAGVTRGDFLKPDANGAAVTASTSDYYGAFAMESIPSGAFGKVQIEFGKL